jgi:hypothetical protein
MKRTVILGAGASRGVSYADEMPVPSFLDRDFFELLQRLEVTERHQKLSIRYVINRALKRPGELWNSMERLFYTLHIETTLHNTLLPGRATSTKEKELRDHFTRATQALLRAAHAKRTCDYHAKLFEHLTATDMIMTFNYDLVPERALRSLHGRACTFGPWLYGFEDRPVGADSVPPLYKLHGSVNWQALEHHGFKVRQTSWAEFEKKPGYTAAPFSILLPFWDKRIEDPPWVDIWRKAASALRETTHLVVWGYSLPLTDLKAQQLIRMTLCGKGSQLEHLCVVDPSRDVRDRWRRQFLRQKFWPYSTATKFLMDPPPWLGLPRGPV